MSRLKTQTGLTTADVKVGSLRSNSIRLELAAGELHNCNCEGVRIHLICWEFVWGGENKSPHRQTSSRFVASVYFCAQAREIVKSLQSLM